MLSSAPATNAPALAAAEQPPSETESKPRSGSRTFLDVFNPPVDASSVSPGASPASNPVMSPSSVASYKASPRFGGLTGSTEAGYGINNFPLSFNGSLDNLPSHGTPGSPVALVFRNISGGSPSVSFRKASRSASINDDFHLGEPLTSTSTYTTRRVSHSSGRQPSITEDDMFRAATSEELSNPNLFFSRPSDERNSDSRRRSFVEGMSSVSLDESVVETTVPLQECPADVFIPFLDRPSEIEQILKVPVHARMIKLIKNEIGDEKYERELLPLWTKTTRREMSDAAWLWKTKQYLAKCTGPSSDGRNWRLWSEFCAMVDFDENNTSIDPKEDWHQHNASHEHLEKIGEEEE